MLVKLLFVSVQLLCVILQINTENCTTPDNKSGECVLLKSCPSLLQLTANKTLAATQFIGKSICGFEGVDSKFCCGPTSSSNHVNNTIVDKQKNESKKKLLPSRKFCGYQHFDDYGHDTNDTGITESPWLARLAYKKVYPNGTVLSDKLVYSCAGSLINQRYVLTSASCTNLWSSVLVEVQLGEYHVRNKTDCVQESTLEECSDPVVTYDVEKVIPHSEYNKQVLYEHDIALIRLKRTVRYSDYIRPICLPYPGTHFANIGDLLTQSGFGFLNSDEGLAVVKKRVLSTLIPNEECAEVFKRAKRFKMTDERFCTIIMGNNTQLSCVGDAGAPVTFSHRLQWHQEGIVSFGKGECGDHVPDIHTKVEKYLDWIEENIEP